MVNQSKIILKFFFFLSFIYFILFIFFFSHLPLHQLWNSPWNWNMVTIPLKTLWLYGLKESIQQALSSVSKSSTHGPDTITIMNW